MKLSHSYACLFATVFFIIVSGRSLASMSGMVQDISRNGDGLIEEAKKTAKSYMTNGGTNQGYHSMKKDDFRDFSGDFAVPELPESKQGHYVYGIALFADDGCEVSINGNLIHNRYKERQALPDLNQSFHQLPILLIPGKRMTYSVKYSNVRFHTKGHQADIDGCTLFLFLVPVEILTDFNRDGIINDEDRGKVTSTQPWRWWINDDSDQGEVSGGKGDGGDIPGDKSPDCRDENVNGMRDLVDYFPLHVDLSMLMKSYPKTKYSYRIKQADAALNFFEVPDAIPNQSGSDGPSAFLRELNTARSYAKAKVQHVKSDGIALSEDMLEAFRNKKGVLVCEATAKSKKPLVLEIKSLNSPTQMEIEFPLHINPVESLYRHANMRSQTPGGGGGITTQLQNPSETYPDELTNGKYFVFVHGYNVGAESARGWNAEIFKRMHQMGSNARFVGLYWHGDTGADYHMAVKHAFLTSEKLANWLRVRGDVTIAAHSLGNMLVSNAIEHEGFRPARYYMINAATPIEAYDPTQSTGEGMRAMAGPMTERRWKPYLKNRKKLFASDWSLLFPNSDGRSQLTWRGRFSKRVPLIAYNFYSTGEDVVKNPRDIESVGVHLRDAILNFDVSSRAWVAQEIAKGSNLMDALLKDTHAGWEFGSYWDIRKEGEGLKGQTVISYRLRNPEEAALLTEDQLRAHPFHEPFKYKQLYHGNAGNAIAREKIIQYELLASAIPATSFAAAANSVPALTVAKNRINSNFNMMPYQINGQWPRSSNSWLHSDIRNVALTYVKLAYDKMINLGGLSHD